MTEPLPTYRTPELIAKELAVAEQGRARTLSCNKVLYNDRIRRLKAELERAEQP